MNIRPYREADLESVALLFTESVHTLAAGHYDPTQCAIWAPIPPEYDAWRERLSTLSTYVAEEGSRLVGFISYKDSGHIELLFTSPRKYCTTTASDNSTPRRVSLHAPFSSGRGSASKRGNLSAARAIPFNVLR
jgi:hypothetical protein